MKTRAESIEELARSIIERARSGHEEDHFAETFEPTFAALESILGERPAATAEETERERAVRIASEDGTDAGARIARLIAEGDEHYPLPVRELPAFVPGTGDADAERNGRRWLRLLNESADLVVQVAREMDSFLPEDFDWGFGDGTDRSRAGWPKFAGFSQDLGRIAAEDCAGNDSLDERISELTELLGAEEVEDPAEAEAAAALSHEERLAEDAAGQEEQGEQGEAAAGLLEDEHDHEERGDDEE